MALMVTGEYKQRQQMVGGPVDEQYYPDDVNIA